MFFNKLIGVWGKDDDLLSKWNGTNGTATTELWLLQQSKPTMIALISKSMLNQTVIKEVKMIYRWIIFALRVKWKKRTLYVL